MKRKYFLLLVIVTAVAGLLYGQSAKNSSAGGITHPWWVVDAGGGKSTGGTMTLQSSIGQPAVQKMSYIDTGMILESGFIPGLRMFSGALVSINYTMEGSWNMVSVPLLVGDYSKNTLFPNSNSKAFAYKNGYVQKDTLERGQGYWLKYPFRDTVDFLGTAIMEDTINVNMRWNIIGTLAYPVLTADITPVPPTTITSFFWGYQPGSGYFSEDTLQPGHAYWVKVSQTGKLVMKTFTAFFPKYNASKIGKNNYCSMNSNARPEGLNVLSIKDANGRERSIYFSSKKTDLDKELFEMPPLPPSGILDMRFETQRSLEIADPLQNEQKFPIIISGAKFPIALSWNIIGDEAKASIIVLTSDGKQDIHEMKENENVIIGSSMFKGAVLSLNPKGPVELPKEFDLYQNYPNPFNPSTKIRYDLPRNSHVTMKIFNLLGQEVITLTDEMQDAGFKTIEWNSTNNLGNSIAGGVYIYRLSAQSAPGSSEVFVSTKKLLLLK